MATNNWFADAGSGASLISLSEFVDEHVFRTEEGGYGTTFRLAGLDPECLSEEQLTAASATVLQALRLLGDNVSVFQVLVKKSGCALPVSGFAESANPVIAETVQARTAFLATRPLFSISLFWTVYVNPPKRRRKPTSAQVETASRQMLRDLRSATANLAATLAAFGPVRLPIDGVAQLYGYIASLDDRLAPKRLRTRENVAAQLASVPTATYEAAGLVVGRRTARPFSLLRRPAHSEANLFGALLRIPADLIAVLECRRESGDATRKAVTQHESFIEAFKHNPLVRYFHRSKEIPKNAKTVAADAAIELSGLGGIVHDLGNGLAYYRFSLVGLIHAADPSILDDQMAQVHRCFGQSEASVMEESVGAISAFKALFPGGSEKGRRVNVRSWQLREDHLARISLGYAPHLGEAYSETLENEALAVFETRDGTPYWLDPFASGPRGMIVTGEPRKGKSFFVNFLIDQEAKYGGYINIFDIGGAYENTVLKHDGLVVKFGLTGPRLNPFALENTEENRQSICRLVAMLLKQGGATINPTQEQDIRSAVAAVCSLDEPELRRLKYLILEPPLEPFLIKWKDGGAYGQIFDNETDELRLARLVSFDFEGIGKSDQGALMQPLLFWIRQRIGVATRDLAQIGVPKLEVYDEAWKHIQDEQMLAGMFDSMKTFGKKMGGIIFATHDPADLGPHAELIRNACPDALFLGGAFNRERFAKLFGMNETQLDLIGTLQRGESLLLRKNYAKVIRLNVDDASKWLYSTHPQDVRRRDEAIREHGREAAFKVLTASGAVK